MLAPHSQWRARPVAYGRDTLAAPDADLAVAPPLRTPPSMTQASSEGFSPTSGFRPK
jgi:hypothetical protein